MSRVPKATQDAASRSPVTRRERVVRRTKSRPVRGDRVGSRSTGNVLGHDSSESGVEVEVDVAVEEPRPRVVRPETDRDVVVRRGRARRDDVAPDGVVVVV